MGQHQSTGSGAAPREHVNTKKPSNMRLANQRAFERKTILEIPQTNLRIIHVDPNKREGIVAEHGYMALRVGAQGGDGSSGTGASVRKETVHGSMFHGEGAGAAYGGMMSMRGMSMMGGNSQSAFGSGEDGAGGAAGAGAGGDAPEFSEETVRELRALRTEVRTWKKDFLNANGRMPNRTDIAAAPDVAAKTERIVEIEQLQMIAGAAKFMEGGVGQSIRQQRSMALQGSRPADGDWEAMLNQPLAPDEGSQFASQASPTTKRSRRESVATDGSAPGLGGFRHPSVGGSSQSSRLVGGVPQDIRRRGIQRFFNPRGEFVRDRIYFQDDGEADNAIDVRYEGEYDIEEAEIHDVAGVQFDGRKRRRSSGGDEEDVLATYEPKSDVLDALRMAVQAPITQFRAFGADDYVDGVADPTLVDKLKEFRVCAFTESQWDFDRNTQQDAAFAALMPTHTALDFVAKARQLTSGGSGDGGGDDGQRPFSPNLNNTDAAATYNGIVGSGNPSLNGTTQIPADDTGAAGAGAEGAAAPMSGEGTGVTPSLANTMTQHPNFAGSVVRVTSGDGLASGGDGGTAATEEAQRKDKIAHRKALHKQLNAWKSAFEAKNGRPPEAFEMAQDPEIREVFGIYHQLKKETKKNKKDKDDDEDGKEEAAGGVAVPSTAGVRLAKLGDDAATDDNATSAVPTTTQVRVYEDDVFGDAPINAGGAGGLAAPTKVSAEHRSPAPAHLAPVALPAMGAGMSPSPMAGLAGASPMGAASAGSADSPQHVAENNVVRFLTDDEKKEMKQLNKHVKIWKKAFKDTEGRNPNRTDIRNDPEITTMYFRLKELQAVEKSGDGGGSDNEGGSPQPTATVDHAYAPLPSAPRDMSATDAVVQEEEIDRRDLEADEAIAFRAIGRAMAAAEGPFAAALAELRRTAAAAAVAAPGEGPEGQEVGEEDVQGMSDRAQRKQSPTTDGLRADRRVVKFQAGDETEDKQHKTATRPGIADPAAHRRRKHLTKELNTWKAAFKAENGREPTSKDIKKDPTIAAVYAEWLSLPKEAPGGAKGDHGGDGDDGDQDGEPNANKAGNGSAAAGSAPKTAAAPALSPAEVKKLKKELTKKLNTWKARFTTEFNREPTSKDIQQDPNIFPVYERYLSLKGGGKGGDGGDGDEGASESAAEPQQEGGPVAAAEGKGMVEEGDAAEAEGASSAPPPEIKAPEALTPEEAVRLQEYRRELGKQLNSWKRDFIDTMGRPPTSTDIKSDPVMAEVFQKYNSISSEVVELQAKFAAERAAGDGKRPMTVVLPAEIALQIEPASPKSDADGASGPSAAAAAFTGATSAPGGSAAATPDTTHLLASPAIAKHRRSSTGSSAEAARKKQLTKQLNVWKANFNEQHERKPKVSDIEADPAIAEVFAEWQRLKAASGGGDGGDDDDAHSNASPSPARPSGDKTSKKQLVGELNAWKAAFREQHGREPTKSDIKADPTISEQFAAYTALRRGSKGHSDNENDKDDKDEVAPSEEPATTSQAAPAASSNDSAPPPSDAAPSQAPPAVAVTVVPAASMNKKELVAALNTWKAAFREQHGREPTKSDIKADPAISEHFVAYMALKKGGAEENDEAAAAVAAPVPAAEQPPQPTAIPSAEPETAATTTPAETAAAPAPLADAAALKRRKKELTRTLNEWKGEFTAANGRPPKGSDIAGNAEMAAAYEELKTIKTAMAAFGGGDDE